MLGKLQTMLRRRKAQERELRVGERIDADGELEPCFEEELGYSNLSEDEYQ